MRRILPTLLALLLAAPAAAQTVSGATFSGTQIVGGVTTTDLTSDSAAEGCWLINQDANDSCTGNQTNDGTESSTITYSYDSTNDLNYYDSTQYITISHHSALDGFGGGSFTVGCFFYLTANNVGWVYGFSKTDNSFSTDTWSLLQLFLKFHFLMGTGQEFTPEDKGINEWFHTVGRYDSTVDELEIYINGANDCDGSCTSDTDGIAGATDDVIIGAKSNGDQPLQGRISQCAVFSRALTDAEICSWCSLGLDGTDTSRNSSICGSCTLP
jgi:hypothetical protein